MGGVRWRGCRQQPGFDDYSSGLDAWPDFQRMDLVEGAPGRGLAVELELARATDGDLLTAPGDHGGRWLAAVTTGAVGEAWRLLLVSSGGGGLDCGRFQESTPVSVCVRQ